MRTILLSLAVLAATPGLLIAPVPGSNTGTATAQGTVTIEAGSDYFCDPEFFGGVCETMISAGDTVTWNVVQGAHTVTECSDDSHTDCPPEGGFDSGILTQGATFSHTFAEPGYHRLLLRRPPRHHAGPHHRPPGNAHPGAHSCAHRSPNPARLDPSARHPYPRLRPQDRWPPC